LSREGTSLEFKESFNWGAKELSDRLWQAFGYDHEPYFSEGQFNFETPSR